MSFFQPTPLLDTSSQILKTSFRQKGKQPTGKLIRGFIQDATIKTNISSIPGKFETVIYSKSPKKGFGTTSTRFIDLIPQEVTENPGPGSYVPLKDTSTSYSVKGYGNGFLSKSTRTAFNNKYMNMGPGPGSYDSSVLTTISTKASNKGSETGSFRSESVQVKGNEKNKMSVPGPGTYNPKDLIAGKEFKTYYSSFVSKKNREEYLQISKYPGPGVYEPKKTLLESKPYKTLGPYSSFALPSEKKPNKARILIDKLQNKQDSELVKIVPGPGFYDVDSIGNNEDTLLDGPSSNFRYGIKDRFGDLIIEKKDKGRLGPGYYPIPIGIAKSEMDKNEVSGSVFMSETGRKPFGELGRKFGPNANVPYKLPIKKSFLLNLKRTWV